MQLTSLEFSSNELNELPLWVCAITALRRLTAGHNKLRRLPAELSQLSGLEALVMPSNEFQQVWTQCARRHACPCHISVLCSSNSDCTALHLSNLLPAPVFQVPRQLESLQHLTRLNLAGTPLDEAGVSTLLSLRRLRRLVVSRSWREDEPLLRALAEQLRAKHGYSVLEVT